MLEGRPCVFPPKKQRNMPRVILNVFPSRSLDLDKSISRVSMSQYLCESGLYAPEVQGEQGVKRCASCAFA